MITISARKLAVSIHHALEITTGCEKGIDLMNVEFTERELQYLNRIINVRLDELLARCARIQRLQSLRDLETSERYSLAEAEIRVLKDVHDKLADTLSDMQFL